MLIHQAPFFRFTGRPRTAFAALTLAILLSACGGGSGSAGPAGPQAPAISSQPAAVTVTAGSAASFSATASGVGLSYQWRRDGVNIAGATASAYTLSAAHMLDDGTGWSVVVTSAGTSVTSAAATLSVKPPVGLSLVAGGLGGRGNADGPEGRLSFPDVLAVNAAGVVHLNHDGLVRTLTASGSGPYVAATKAWPLPYNFDYMVRDARFLGTLNHYRAIAFDASGNLFGLYGNHLIKVTPDGVQSHIAGADAHGFADGPGAVARFNQPTGLAIDKTGTIYITDFHNARIRTVSPEGLVSTHAAATAALAASGAVPTPARHIALDGAGNLYLGGGARVHKVTPAGVASTIDMASQDSIVADKAGNVYSSDDCRILKASSTGVVSILVADLRDAGQSASGKSVVSCRQILAIGNDDNLYIGDYNSSTVRKFTAAGVMTTIGGKAGQDNVADRDGIGAEARLGYAEEMGVDGQGNM